MGEDANNTVSPADLRIVNYCAYLLKKSIRHHDRTIVLHCFGYFYPKMAAIQP